MKNKKMPLELSVITPLYNAEEYLRETAGSVLSQSYANFEWIIVDDCSTDSSPEMVKELAREDSRVRPIFLSRNSGPIRARNRAIKEAGGRFIAFIDSDDTWLPGKLEKQIAFMKQNSLGFTYTGYKKMNIRGDLKTGITVPVPKKVSYSRLLQSNCIIASTIIYDTRITGPILQKEDVPVGKDDFHFFLELIERTGAAYGLKEDLLRFRIHGDSITGNKARAAKAHWSFFRNCLGLSFFRSLFLYAAYTIRGSLKYLL
jgi:teichuronic acid biosynthesis glycosyltransferase TuaG